MTIVKKIQNSKLNFKKNKRKKETQKIALSILFGTMFGIILGISKNTSDNNKVQKIILLNSDSRNNLTKDSSKNLKSSAKMIEF